MQGRSRGSAPFSLAGASALLVGELLVLVAIGCATPPERHVTEVDDRVLSTDLASDVGLDFVHVNGMFGEFLFHEMTGSGVGLFDLERDGDLDLYLVQGHPLREGERELPERSDAVYRSSSGDRGLPVFEDVTTEVGLRATGYGLGVAVGDVDDDGLDDLYVTNYGPDQLWAVRPGGALVERTAEAGLDLPDPGWSTSAAFLDFDRDGHLDLWVVRYVIYDSSTDKPCLGADGRPDYCGPQSYAPDSDRLFRNQGGGRFVDVTERAGVARPGAGLGVVARDFDEDGWVDVYVANDQMHNRLWRNRGDGTFEDVALERGVAVDLSGLPQASMGVIAEDLDLDGDDDLFLTHLEGEANAFYRNDGGWFIEASAVSGLAAPSLPRTGFGTVVVDLGNDGALDLVVANGAVKTIDVQERAGDPHPLRQSGDLLRNDGSGKFGVVAHRDLAVPAVGRGAVAGDLDDDGDLDVLITRNDGPPLLLFDLEGQERPWLGLELRRASGRHDLGAVALLELDDGTILRRTAASDGSYLSAGDPRVHFGLAGRAAPSGLVIRWSDGSVERHPVPPLGRYTRMVLGRPDGAGR